jgi:hypothetical protein
MKCPYCKVEIFLSKFQPPNDNIKEWTCPEGHITLKKNDQYICQYTLFWDADEQAIERYKLFWSSVAGKTVLSKKDSQAGKYYRGFNYREVMTIDGYFPLLLNEDQVIQVDNLVPRLLRLKAFS